MSLNIGRKGQIFLKKEAVYGVEEPLVTTNFMRHINANFDYDPFNRVTSAERKQSPGAVNRFDRRTTAGLKTLAGLLRPSGVLNTVPECDPALECGFGSKRSVTLSTTIASGGAVGGATLTSGAGLAVGDPILLLVGGVKYVRFLLTVAGAVVTWAPNLPGVPAGAVKAGICYNLSTDLALSLTVLHSIQAFKRELLGVGVDSLELDFDGTEEPRFSASGPAKSQLTGTAQAVPGTATQVGANPPTGMAGELYIGNTAYLHTKLKATIKNGLAVRNVEAGTSAASEVYRAARREVMLSLDAFGETEATLYDLAEAGTETAVFRQVGRTEGNIVALYAPRVEFKVPDTADDEGAIKWPFQGMCLESADASNDEIRLAIL